MVKRPASSSAGSVLKKPATAAQVLKEKVSSVVGALKEAEQVPASARTMLVKIAPDCLGVYAADRHEFQTSAVDMIGDALAGYKSCIEDKIKDADTKLGEAATEKESRATKAAEAESKAKELAEVVAAKQAELEEAEALAAKGDDELTAATAAVASFDDEMKATEQTLSDLKEQLAALEAGPLVSFEDLKTYAPPPPPVEEPAAEEPAAEAPAEEAAPATTS
mmetsp:Transcript_46584/g.110776  ORF Transcript_46584/g.110776 Transcript_46584/m.110776 type:complete len:222 (+) Transcript_46584:74-739(+)